jgi:hypothetical protein
MRRLRTTEGENQDGEFKYRHWVRNAQYFVLHVLNTIVACTYYVML